MGFQLESMHQIMMEDACDMSAVDSQSIDLVVTSPPYPMIQMWDEQFSAADPAVAEALSQSNSDQAFEIMHLQLDGIWEQLYRVLKPGGIACVNVGDATRTIGGHFQLFSNHARIITKFCSIGFSQMPGILWRKPTNAPNKFMGSGMLPPSAYVTLEHEHILIFRKGGKRNFPEKVQKQVRRESAYFWEERNIWFSDIWIDLRGAQQALNNPKSRERSAAFPMELPFRLINMFSAKGDIVLDPYLGSGTTMQAAMCTGRNCLGYELDQTFQSVILEKIASIPEMANQIILERINAHELFVQERMRTKGDLSHSNIHYGFPVMTRQEEDLFLNSIRHLQYLSDRKFKIFYNAPDSSEKRIVEDTDHASIRPQSAKGRQLKLF